MCCSTLRALIRLTIGISAAFLLSACEDGSNEASADAPAESASAPAEATADGPRNACVLLTAADVGGIIGETVRDSLALEIPAGGPAIASQCNYATADNPAAVGVLLRRSLPGETVEGASGSVRQTFSEAGIELEDVAGLGEVAFWGSNQLHVFVGQDWYVVISPTVSGGLAQARALADIAIAKL